MTASTRLPAWQAASGAACASLTAAGGNLSPDLAPALVNGFAGIVPLSQGEKGRARASRPPLSGGVLFVCDSVASITNELRNAARHPSAALTQSGMVLDTMTLRGVELIRAV